MNLAQVIRRALIQTNQVRQDGSSTAWITQPELVGVVQDCHNEVNALLKMSDEDWNLKTLDSRATGGSAAFTFEGETYTPTTSLRTAASTREYTLPPDFLRMKRMRIVTNGFQYVRFSKLDVDDPVFVGIENAENVTTGTSTPDVFYYDITGRRTLRFANWPGRVLDMEIMYEARQPTLWIYDGETTSTAGVTLDDATVPTTAGTATRFLDSELSTPSVIYFNSTGATGHPSVMGTSTSAEYISPAPRRIGSTGVAGPFQVASFTTDIELEMSKTYPFATDAALGYMLCSAPEQMETHSQLYVEYLKSYLYEKVGNLGAADRARKKYGQAKGQFKTDIQSRSTGIETVEDFDFGVEY